MHCSLTKFLACAVLGVVAIGCGGKAANQPDLGQVSGTVTLDGQPLANVVVSFEPQAGGRASIGRTNESGVYELTFDVAAPGAVVGAHKVSISTPSEGPSPTGEAPKDPIPAKYNSATTLTETVSAGANTINFELSTK